MSGTRVESVVGTDTKADKYVFDKNNILIRLHGTGTTLFENSPPYIYIYIIIFFIKKSVPTYQEAE